MVGAKHPKGCACGCGGDALAGFGGSRRTRIPALPPAPPSQGRPVPAVPIRARGEGNEKKLPLPTTAPARDPQWNRPSRPQPPMAPPKKSPPTQAAPPAPPSPGAATPKKTDPAPNATPTDNGWSPFNTFARSNGSTPPAQDTGLTKVAPSGALFDLGRHAAAERSLWSTSVRPSGYVAPATGGSTPAAATGDKSTDDEEKGDPTNSDPSRTVDAVGRTIVGIAGTVTAELDAQRRADLEAQRIALQQQVAAWQHQEALAQTDAQRAAARANVQAAQTQLSILPQTSAMAPPAPAPMSTGTKVAIGGGVVLALGLAGYVASRRRGAR